MSNAPARTALWTTIHLDLDGITATQHVRIPIALVPVTPAQTFLGLGA